MYLWLPSSWTHCSLITIHLDSKHKPSNPYPLIVCELRRGGNYLFINFLHRYWYWISGHPGIRPNAYIIQFWRQSQLRTCKVEAHEWWHGECKGQSGYVADGTPPASLIAKAQWDTCRRWYVTNPTKMERTHYLSTIFIVLLHLRYICIVS